MANSRPYPDSPGGFSPRDLLYGGVTASFITALFSGCGDSQSELEVISVGVQPSVQLSNDLYGSERTCSIRILERINRSIVPAKPL